MPPLTLDKFDVLAARTGIAFTDAQNTDTQKTVMRKALPAADRIAELVSRLPPRAAGSALTLSVESVLMKVMP